MPFLNFIRKIKSFSVIVLPDDTSYKARTRKFTMVKALSLLTLYSIVIAILGYYILNLTGMGPEVLPGKFGLRGSDLEKVEQLNSKILFLAKELQSIKSTNEKLKYALILGDSSLVDSINLKIDSLENNGRSNAEGNVLGVFLSLLKKINTIQVDPIFFIKPIDGFISRKFDSDKGHMGMDIVAKVGTPIFSTAGGFVIFSGYTVNFGNIVIVNHSHGYISVYKHCSSILKSEREKVEQGETIAISGNSGTKSTGPHLHFEIWKDGQAIDPMSVLINN
ncbi:MAG: M23 family metallopeptidase [Promethearchaeota archaeon]|jgi:murein DD-endopeptidase MepM/ murein hydrolase activator NlpD